jgi:hypothetical protein
MSETSTKPAEASRSKILRLAFADRMLLNRMIRDGFTATTLIHWLRLHGVPDVNPQNLSKYKVSREYRNWLADESQIDRDRENTEQAMRLAEAMGGTATDKLKSILAGRLFTIMPGAATEDVAKLVEAVNAVTKAERLELQRRQVSQRDEVIALDREKFETDLCEKFLEWFKDAKAREIAESPASKAEQIAALRAAYFKDVDEMEASGAVELPK